MTTYCCGWFYFVTNLNRGDFCLHPNAPKERNFLGERMNVIYKRRRPSWCPIKIIPIEEVRQVLDAKEKKYGKRQIDPCN